MSDASVNFGLCPSVKVFGTTQFDKNKNNYFISISISIYLVPPTLRRYAPQVLVFQIYYEINHS